MEYDVDRAIDDARKLRNDPLKMVEACDWLLQFDELREEHAAEVLGMKGFALRAMGLLKDAECELIRASQLALKIDNHHQLATCYLHLAAIKTESHLFGEARRYLAMARHGFILCCSLAGEARVLFSVANILIMEKRYAEARLALDDAMQNYSEIDHIEGMSQVMASFAVISMQEGDFENAIERLMECERLFLSLDSKKNALTNNINLAYCYQRLGNLAYAKILLFSTREKAKAQGFHIIEAEALIVLSNIGQLEGDVEDASMLFYAARELSLKHGFHEMFGALCGRLEAL